MRKNSLAGTIIETSAITTLALTLLLLPALTALATGIDSVDAFAGQYKGNLLTGIRLIVNSLLALAAVIAAIFIIISGVMYITSQGDEQAVQQAKNQLIYAVVGIIIIALAAALVNFIINAI